MDSQNHLVYARKLLEVCGCNNESVLYSAVPLFDKKALYSKGLFAYSFRHIPDIIDSSIELLSGKKTQARKTSYEYKAIKDSKKQILEILDVYNQTNKEKISKISSDKTLALLSYLSHIHLDSFSKPIQCFIPDSSITTGQFEFWDSINLLELRKRLYGKDFQFKFKENISKSDVWNLKMNIDMFDHTVKERIIKEKSIHKKLDPLAMVKALVIRIGELGLKQINYEILDLSVRNTIGYLGVKHYIRVDREMMFLRKLEEETKNIMKNLI